MALNPIVFTEKVVRSFLRYQLTSYPFADARLHQQMRRLLSLDETRQSPLLKGPFISLSRAFRTGASVTDLISQKLLHPHMRQRIPVDITHVWGHQEDAIRSIRSGRTTLISTGTGSGKTECFLYPIISRCLDLKDENATAGISAVLVYPMNALAEDQLGRMRSLLAGTGISFGMYVGKTPEKESDVTGIRLQTGSSRADYEARLAEVRREKRSDTVHPPEELCSREMMRKAGSQPRILLTNVKQLDLMNHKGVWRCRSCRRRTTRRTPLRKCTAWRCDGQLEFLQEDPDNYDLQLLDQAYSMLRPEEHTAMVPQDERERLETSSKERLKPSTVLFVLRH